MKLKTDKVSMKAQELQCDNHIKESEEKQMFSSMQGTCQKCLAAVKSEIDKVSVQAQQLQAQKKIYAIYTETEEKQMLGVHCAAYITGNRSEMLTSIQVTG